MLKSKKVKKCLRSSLACHFLLRHEKFHCVIIGTGEKNGGVELEFLAKKSFNFV